MTKRNIDDILQFRSDISPFLVHLTRKGDNGEKAFEKLVSILDSFALVPGKTEVSIIKYGGNTTSFSSKQKRKFFSSVCFTETPLDETHCLLEIKARKVDLEPYGVVFLKRKLQRKGVSPVLYINNEAGDKDKLIQALFELIKSRPAEAKKILPLFSIFGKMITPHGAKNVDRTIDFLWEREWRYPAAFGPFEFGLSDVFVGLCPDEDIKYFEKHYAPLKFIDPRRPLKWYATRLRRAKARLDLEYSIF